ncbi:MAG: Uma2 family endonuclease [Acidimicrobiales bacterium]
MVTAAPLPLHRWTVEDYDRMVAAGVLTKEDEVELIDGEVVDVASMGAPHAYVVRRLDLMLQRLVGDRAIVQVQAPVRIPPRSEPEPDLALLRWRGDFYPDLPGAADVLLVIEVADSSARSDRRRKVPLYAGAGIPQLWLVDVSAGVLEDHRGPEGGGYREVTVLRPGQRAAVGMLADVSVDVGDLVS